MLPAQSNCARCSVCGINWYVGTHLCGKCNGPTSYVVGEKPHTKEEIEALMSTTEDTPKLDKVEAWRFSEFLKHGLDLERAQEAASRRDIEVERFRSLTSAGCPPIQAWEIVR